MLFSFPNQASSATLHGGVNWTSLNNLKTSRLAARAIWSGTYDYQANFVVDRGAGYYLQSLKAIALIGHNLTAAATITVSGHPFRAYSSANVSATYNGTGGLYGQGQMTGAPATLNSVSLAAGDAILLKDQTTPAQNGQWRVTTVGTGSNGVWDRVSTDLPATTTFTVTGPARTCADSEAGALPGLAFVASEAGFTNSRYLGITVSDEDGLNENGALEFGYLWIGDGFAPVLGPSFGWSLGYEDLSLVETSLGGIDYVDPRPKYRVLRFGLDHLTSDEWATQGLALSRDLGITQPLLFIMSTTDATLGERVSFMGRLRTLSPIENPDPLRFSTAFEVKELVG